MEGIKSSIGDAFLTLPLIITGFTFFLGTLTSNISLLYLFLGHITAVPALSTFFNMPPFFSSGKFNILQGVGWFLSMLIIFGIYSSGLNAALGSEKDKDKLSYLLFIAIPIFGFLAFLRKDTPSGQHINLLSYFSKYSNDVTPSPLCSIIPGLSDEKIPQIHTGPSAWVVNIAFFFGFVMSNVITIYNMPKPSEPTYVTVGAGSEETVKEQTNKLEARVNFRKTLVFVIGCITTALFLLLLYFRFYDSGCEKNIVFCLTPIILCYLAGMAFFQLLYNSCGILPTDVLGIANGAISPDLIDTPIICTGDTI